MGKINFANFKKTIYYLKRNGIKNTCYAVRERLAERKAAPYSYVPVSEPELAAQRRWSVEAAGRCSGEAAGGDTKITFSIVVPTYRTNETYLREMIQSVADQTYPYWELVLADATEDDSVKLVVDKMQNRPEKLRYIKLPENISIADNTNQALLHASGDYIGLLDHDDVLTPDALYEMAVRIEAEKKNGVELQMLFSDEDKCNGDRTSYYERNRKEEFNLDLLLSNNYICHFLVMKSELIKELGFRSEYNGAQDYDLVLRAAKRLLLEDAGAESGLPNDTGGSNINERITQIAYIPKVLYHWRCHVGSTAENPQSKQYAYDAGLRALQDFADSLDFRAKAVYLKHLGFYMLEYPRGILESRRDLGAVGGRILGKASAECVKAGKRDGVTGVIGIPEMDLGGLRVIGGRMSSGGEIYYEGLPVHYSGYLHRAVLTQTAEAVDIRCIQVREECRALFEKITGVPYAEIPWKEKESDADGGMMIFDAATLPAGTDYRALSLKLCRALHEAGYHILYYPAMEIVWKGEQHG